MVQKIQRRLRDGGLQDGFTLIELMVVVMIIAILVAIAIPSFFSARKRAQDSSAKSSLGVSLNDAQAIYTDDQIYPAAATLAPMLVAEEPNITFNAGGVSTDPKTVSVGVASSTAGTQDVLVLAAKSASGKCFYTAHVATPELTAAGEWKSGTWKFQQAAPAAGCDSDDVTKATAWVKQ